MLQHFLKKLILLDIMCGIFGFISKSPKNAVVTLNGLKELEYRGYDSWGIAIKELKSEGQKSENNKQESKILVEKHIGKIGKATLNSKFSILNSCLSVGHTRWATHGGVNLKNSHPHLDCTKQIALVHNGIVENYEDLKSNLLKKGHKFLSQTDTEAMVHLIEEKAKNKDFISSVIEAFNKLTGLNAFVVIDAKSNQLIACKNGSPLIVGYGNNAYYISSDVNAFPKDVKKIYILKDHQVILLGKDIKLYDTKNGKQLSFEKIELKRNLEIEKKGKYKHFLLKEIYDQPEILEKLTTNQNSTIQKLANDINSAFGTSMLGCGSASYAAMAGEYLLSKIAKKHVNFSVGSEFKYLQDFITKKSLILPISQSGETIDIVEPVKNAQAKGAKIVSIVNSQTSTLTSISDYSLFLNAGVEKAVVGTKSFTAMVGMLLLTSFAVTNQVKIAKVMLLKTEKNIKEIMSSQNIANIKKLAKRLKNKDNIFAIGRGLSYVTALEAALKLKETALIHAEGYAGGELKHGVIALIEKGTPCFVFAPNDETYSEIISNAQEIRARGGFIIGIGPKGNSVFDVFLKTADLNEATIIPQVVYMQLLAYYLALERGVKDPDKPRNLAKSVTVK